MNAMESAALKRPSQQPATALALYATAAAAIFALLCLAGMVTRYSPIPFGDDWEGYVGFNLDLVQGKTSAWWALDDAHRLVLPRALLWLDFHLFGARFVFVLVTNVLMRIGILVAFLALVRERLAGGAWLLLALLSTILAFSWMQAPSFYHAWVGNIAFMAVLLPLLAFDWLHRTKSNGLWFIAAASIGFVSIGTMANGLLVLPIMTAMSAIASLGWRRTLILGVLAVAAFVLYFWSFTYPEETPPNPVTFLLFVLTYLGSPFYYIVYYWAAGLQHAASFVHGHSSLVITGSYLDYPGSRTAGIGVAIFAGALFVLATAAITWRWLRSERTDTWQAALLAFIGFVFASAALVAIGRATFGFDYALEERYTTGTMLAWQALAALLLARTKAPAALRTLTAVAVALPIMLLPNQLKAVLKPDLQDQMARERSLKALQTGQSDDPEIARDVKRLKEMGIKLAE